MDSLERAKQLFLDALALQARRDFTGAGLLYEKALELAPHRASVMNNLATVYLELERYADARVLCERLLEINPDDETALINLGNCQIRTDSAEAALVSYEKALKAGPGYEVAHNNRGKALLELNRPDDALASFDHALTVKPDYAEAHYNRGNALLKLGRLEQALASYECALDINPGHADMLNNRGNVLLQMKRLEEALASYDQALAGKPDHADALNNRCIALLEMGRPEKALESAEHALIVKPDHANTLNSRGIALLELNRREEFIRNHKSLLAIAPDFSYASGSLLNAQLHCCEWAGYDESAGGIREDVRAGRRADTPFNFLAISDSAADQLQCAKTFIADKYPSTSRPIWRGDRYRHDRIRLAYISADYHNHAVANLMVELFETHDRSKFETSAISIGPDHEDAMRRRLEKAFDRFIPVQAKSDLEVATVLRDLEIDIAVDLQGFTKGCRAGILAHRAAPVQVNYLGYPGTMGADYIDYIIADRGVIPQEHHPYYTEKVVYLPDCYQANSRRAISSRIPTRAELALPEEGFVFCCFNNNYKISPAVFGLWMRLLSEVSGSVLWLLEDNTTVACNLRSEAARRGVEPARLIFAPRVTMEEHLARHRQADLFLDTLPYNAHVTASDSLRAGLPVLTCMGNTFASRVAASLLNAMGLPELVATTHGDYEKLALKLATDGKQLADIKARLARNRTTHPLFNTDRFREHIEAAYVTMQERAQRGESPVSFAVPMIS